MRSSKLGKHLQAKPREVALRRKLQASYDEQAILVQHQQTLLAELDQLYGELMHVALTDALTGLPNYRAVMSKLEEALAHCQRTRGSCAVLLLDLNHFKYVNDTWGHRAGDQLLHEVAQRLRAALRLEDFVGRYGGEEFVILLPEVDRQAARQMAEYLCSVIVSLPYFWQSDNGAPAVSLSLSVSIGMAIYPLLGGSSKVLLEAADRAMYQAKYIGCCVCLADGEMTSPRVMLSLQNEEQHTAEVMVVQAFRAATAAYDRGTETHAQRMAYLAKAVARQLKRSEEETHLTRPYRRDPLTLLEARTELQRCTASQYDPQVVEAFMSVLAEQENMQGPPEEATDPGTSATPNPTMRVTTDQVWEQGEAWRQQQLTWQQRREAWQQQQQQFARQKQELEQQHKLLRKQVASRNTNRDLTSSRS